MRRSARADPQAAGAAHAAGRMVDVLHDDDVDRPRDDRAKRCHDLAWLARDPRCARREGQLFERRRSLRNVDAHDLEVLVGGQIDGPRHDAHVPAAPQQPEDDLALRSFHATAGMHGVGIGGHPRLGTHRCSEDRLTVPGAGCSYALCGARDWSRPMRLAWIGPMPSSEGGVPSMATQQLLGLSAAGVEIEAFVSSHAAALPVVLASRPGLVVHPPVTRWQYDRWYSRADLALQASSAVARTTQLRRIGAKVVALHEARPFDAVYQFAMPELFALHGRRRRLPPVVVHPEVHAAGELRWHRRERALTAGNETSVRHLGVRSMLAVRSAMQHMDLSRADLVIAPAARFAQLLNEDCGVAADRIRVVPNPIDVGYFRPVEPAAAARRGDEPRRVLFVSRIAVRKGVEAIVALSHAIADLEGRVVIDVLGDRSLWSDYRHLLAELHPGTAVAVGHISSEQLRGRLQTATAILQPSRYEPFALTVAEALACGTPAITSDEVGATEQVDPRVGVRVPAGDVGALEQALRTLLTTVEAPAAEHELRALARAEGERLFATDVVGRQLSQVLETYVRAR